jgi:predicted RNase H-like HicB family nuclease
VTTKQRKRGRVVLERGDGWWIASRPGVPGAYSQGKTRASARRNLADAEREIARAKLDVGARVYVRAMARFRGVVVRHERGRVLVELPSGERLHARAADVEPMRPTRAASAQRRALGLGSNEPFEYHAVEGRRLTSDEHRFAEDRQVLEAVAISEPTTAARVADWLSGYESTNGPRLRDRYILDWGDSKAMRLPRVRTILARLVDAGLVERVGRQYTTTRAGYKLLGWAKWAARHRDTIAKLRATAKRQSRRDGRRRVVLVFEKGDGWWVASIPGVPGAYSQGRTKRSAKANLLDAMRLAHGVFRPAAGRSRATMGP